MKFPAQDKLLHALAGIFVFFLTYTMTFFITKEFAAPLGLLATFVAGAMKEWLDALEERKSLERGEWPTTTPDWMDFVWTVAPTVLIFISLQVTR